MIDGTRDTCVRVRVRVSEMNEKEISQKKNRDRGDGTGGERNATIFVVWLCCFV